jgi:hypothetical protein
MGEPHTTSVKLLTMKSIAANLTFILSNIAYGHLLEWQSPTSFTNGSALTAGNITGYRIYKKLDGKYQLHSTTSATKLEVVDGTYAVSATHKNGQTRLSDPVTFPLWESSLEPPTTSNTISPSDSRTAIQTRISALKPGGVLYFRAGDYKFVDPGSFLIANASGIAGNYVTLRNYPGERPVLVGSGWLNEKAGPIANQTLLDITGKYVRVYGLNFRQSGEYGIGITGSNCWIEECESHSNWQANICAGINSVPGVDVNSGTIIHCKTHHSRMGVGITINLDNRENYNADGWTIKRCISYRNGFNDDNRINEFGGGNADGTGCTKYAHDNYAYDWDWKVNGRANRIRNFHVVDNILYLNADDGVDVSSGEGTLFTGNISASNGPSGTMGYKQLRAHYETSTYSGNTAIGRRDSIFPADTLYFDAASATPIKAGDTVTGSISGAKGSVTGGFLFTNGNSAQAWSAGKPGVVYLKDPSGGFHVGEPITVNGVTLANVAALGQTRGCDHRANTTVIDKPHGRNNEIAWTSLFHNQPGSGSIRGISTITAADRGGDAINNLSYFNQDSDIFTSLTEATNFKNSSTIPPNITNPGYAFETPELQGSSIRLQWTHLYRSINSQLMATKDGNLYGKGTLAIAYYHTNPADDPVNPSDPADHSKMHWFRGTKADARPDIGAFQYEEIYAPLILRSSASGTVPPKIDRPKGLKVRPE